jgi:hypothetical protein
VVRRWNACAKTRHNDASSRRAELTTASGVRCGLLVSRALEGVVELAGRLDEAAGRADAAEGDRRPSVRVLWLVRLAVCFLRHWRASSARRERVVECYRTIAIRQDGLRTHISRYVREGRGVRRGVGIDEENRIMPSRRGAPCFGFASECEARSVSGMAARDNGCTPRWL